MVKNLGFFKVLWAGVQQPGGEGGLGIYHVDRFNDVTRGAIWAFFQNERCAMNSTFFIPGQADQLLDVLFPTDERGLLNFGFAGHSRVPAELSVLEDSGVEIIDYLMEGFVPYKVVVVRASDGIRIHIVKSGTNRDQHIDWFVEKYIGSKGLTFEKTIEPSAAS